MDAPPGLGFGAEIIQNTTGNLFSESYKFQTLFKRNLEELYYAVVHSDSEFSVQCIFRWVGKGEYWEKFLFHRNKNTIVEVLQLCWNYTMVFEKRNEKLNKNREKLQVFKLLSFFEMEIFIYLFLNGRSFLGIQVFPRYFDNKKQLE